MRVAGRRAHHLEYSADSASALVFEELRPLRGVGIAVGNTLSLEQGMEVAMWDADVELTGLTSGRFPDGWVILAGACMLLSADVSTKIWAPPSK